MILTNLRPIQVIARIFYCVNRSWSGRISVAELRRSNLLSVIAILEHEEDINQVTAYFSYEHFYVIYCKFWELDRDHDLFIDKTDLTKHNDHGKEKKKRERKHFTIFCINFWNWNFSTRALWFQLFPNVWSREYSVVRWPGVAWKAETASNSPRIKWVTRNLCGSC